MNCLLDTQMLIWVANDPGQLPQRARALIADTGNNLFFSAASLWEIAIKFSLNRADFRVDPHILRQGLLDNGYHEISISGVHAVAVKDLPPIHKDPFDRILIVQAKLEGITLLTSDATIARYESPMLLL